MLALFFVCSAIALAAHAYGDEPGCLLFMCAAVAVLVWGFNNA